MRYEVILSGGSDSNRSVITNGSSLMTNIIGLEEDTEYNISLRAHTSVGPGPFSGIVTERTEEDGWLFFMYSLECTFASFHAAPASPPQNVTATVLSPTEIQVNWTGVLKRDQNGIITQYEVKYKPLMTFGVLPILTVNTTNLSVMLVDLEEYVEYNISVRAYTSVGPGPYSMEIMRRTFEFGM